MSRETTLKLLSLFLVGACIALGVAFRSSDELSFDPQAFAKPGDAEREPPRVQYINPRVGSLTRAVRMAAEIKPDREAFIKAKVSGYVLPHPLEVGTRVDPASPGNDVLLRISVPELDAAVVTASSRVVRAGASTAEAAASVLEAQQGLAEAKALERQAVGMIEAAKADLREHEHAFTLADKIFKRLQTVLAETENLVAQDQVDRAEGARNIAEAQVAEVKVGVQRAKDDALVATARVAAAAARITAAEAGVTAAGAEKSLAESMLKEAEAIRGFATVKAPFKGVVADRMVDTGDLVLDGTRNSGAKPLFRIVADDKLRVRFFVSEPDTPMCKVGNKVEVMIDVLTRRGDKGYTAKVVRVADALDPRTRTMEVEAELVNPKGPDGEKLLRTDMFARVKLFLDTRENVLVVPAACVKTKKRKSSVMVVQADNTVEQISVEIGVDDGIEIEITGGSITKDSKIVSRGANLVRKGAKVVAVKAPAGKKE